MIIFSFILQELEILKRKNNNSNKFSIIDLGKCGKLLKEHYNINENTSLILMKYERLGNISSERSLQYEVYEPHNKTKLNLSICEEENKYIDIYIPVVLSNKTQNLFNELKEMGYDLFDINSPFYNDICIPYKSIDSTDVLLSDRINSYYDNDDISCQSNCKFSDYLFESNYLKCECDMKNSEINVNEAKSFNAKSIYESFYSVLKFSNYKVLKCSNLAFKTKNFTFENKGSIVSLTFILIQFILLMTYLIKGVSQIKVEFSKNILKNFIENHDNKIINEEKINELKLNKNRKRKNINNKNHDKNNLKLKSKHYKNDDKNKCNQNKIKDIKINKRDIQKNILINPPKKKIFIFKNSKLNSKYENNFSKLENSKFNKSSSSKFFSKPILLDKHINNIDKKAEQ